MSAGGWTRPGRRGGPGRRSPLRGGGFLAASGGSGSENPRTQSSGGGGDATLFCNRGNVAGSVDYLVTCNLRYIANAVARAAIERACRLAGYRPTAICTPQELLETDQ